MTEKKPLVVIVGPTASGKSALSMKLAQTFSGEIISADSRTIYRKLDIGTAKPTRSDRRRIPHYCIDIVDPEENFSLAQFKDCAQKALEKIWGKNKLPFLVGGTGLYLDAVIYDFRLSRVPPNPALRKKLSALPLTILLEKLAALDPEALVLVDRHNPRRVIRALEVALAGQSISRARHKQLPEAVLLLGLNPSRSELEQRIRDRVAAMRRRGFVQEVKALLERYPADQPAFSGIGYRPFIEYLSGRISLAEASERFIRGDLKLARRQMAWFKRNTDIRWIKTPREAERVIRAHLKRFPL